MVRVGTSFISIEQARRNLELEIPDVVPELSDRNGLMIGTLEHTAAGVRRQWVEKLDAFKIDGATDSEKEIFYTAVVRTLQYPNEQHEQDSYFSAYDTQVHKLKYGEESYTGYSIWDTFRAAWAWQILFSPERIPGFINSMLADYQQVLS
jgi:putative alpha-1,2-mannosidase